MREGVDNLTPPLSALVDSIQNLLADETMSRGDADLQTKLRHRAKAKVWAELKELHTDQANAMLSFV